MKYRSVDNKTELRVSVPEMKILKWMCGVIMENRMKINSLEEV